MNHGEREGDWTCPGCGREYTAEDAKDYGITCGMEDCALTPEGEGN